MRDIEEITKVYAPIYQSFKGGRARWMFNDHHPISGPALALLGEGPSSDECELGQPFVGPSGIILEAAFEFANILREQTFITNTFPFEKPKDYNWKVSDSDIAAPYLHHKLQKFPVIVCLGKPAWRIYNDAQESIIENSGNVFEHSKFGQKIIPSIHPAYALKAMTSEQGDEAVFWYLVLALKNAKGVLRGEDVFSSTTRHKANLIINKEGMRTFFNSIPKEAFCSIDYEATSTNPYLSSLPLCVGLSWDGATSYTIAFNPWFPQSNILFQDFLKLVEECDHANWIMHNLLYDYPLMVRFGYKGKPPAIDTMYLAHLGFEFMPKGLKFLASFFCRIKPYSFSFKNIEPFIRMGPEAYKDYEYWLVHLLHYCGVDAISTRLLLSAIPQFTGADWVRIKKVYNEYAHRLLLKLHKVQKNGMILNLAILETIRKQLKQEIAQSEAEFKTHMPSVDNINSNLQLADAFKRIAQNDPKLIPKTKTGRLSLTADVLKKMDESGILPAQSLMRYRKANKLLTTYVESYPTYIDSKSLIHTQFALAKTGRLKSKDPALQVLPRKSIILALFTAAVGEPPYDVIIVKADYSAAEAREMAYFSGIPELLDPTVDVHILSATIFYEVTKDQVTPDMRQTTKNLTFGAIYGASPKRVAVLIFGNDSPENVEKARVLLDEKFFVKFKPIKQFMKNREADVANLGYVEAPVGLRRHFPLECMIRKLSDPNAGREFGQLGRSFGWRMYSKAQRESYNFYPQTGVAYLTNVALCNLDDAFEEMNIYNYPRPTVNLQIHDALIPIIHKGVFVKALALMREVMLRPIIGDLVIPVEFSIGWDLKNQVKVIMPEESINPQIDWPLILSRLKESNRDDLVSFVNEAIQLGKEV